MKLRLQLLRNNSGRMEFRKRSLIEWLVLIISFWSFLFEPISALPGPLSYLKYLPDGILLALIILTLTHGHVKVQRKLFVPAVIAFSLFLYTLILYLFRYQSIAFYLWGFRNNFRFIIVLFAFATALEKADIESWFRWVDVLFWLNFLITIFQFAVLGLRGDYLGGIFGITKGANADTIVLISVVVGRSFLRTFQGEEKIWLCMLKSACSIFLTAAAELKVMFVFFPLLLIGASFLTKYSWRKMLLLCVAAVILLAGAEYATALFDYRGTLTLENLWRIAVQKSYSSATDVNRLSAISSLAERIVQNPVERFFGLGLGNCDTSAFAACNTPFYRRYGYLHYTWNMAAMLFLEMGYVGLGIYFLFLFSCGWCIYRQYKKGEGNRVNNQLALLITALCLPLAFYNACLRTETAYLIYMVLAIPFIKEKAEKESTATLGEKGKKQYEI